MPYYVYLCYIFVYLYVRLAHNKTLCHVMSCYVMLLSTFATLLLK